MSRLARDGTAEPVSRDQILRHARGQGNIIFPVQLTTSRVGNLARLIHTLLYTMTIHTTCMHTYIRRAQTFSGKCLVESLQIIAQRDDGRLESRYRGGTFGNIFNLFLIFPHNRGMLRRSRCVLIFL